MLVLLGLGISEEVRSYFKWRHSAIFSSVISPAPDMRLISNSFLPIASAVMADACTFLGEVRDLGWVEFF